MIDKELLDILACPETKEPVYMAHQSVVDELNGRIERGEVKNRGGKGVERRWMRGWCARMGPICIRSKTTFPIMLIDEAIPIGRWVLRRSAPNSLPEIYPPSL